MSFAPERFEDRRPMLLGGTRQRHTFAAAGSTIPAQWRTFAALVPLAGQRGTTTYGVVCQSDAEGFEYMCAAEVDDLSALPAGTGRMRVPAQRYAVFVHRGHVSGLRSTWERIWNDWLPSSGLRPADTPDFELYDDRFDPASGTGTIEIWFPVEESSE
jgi:AraC family transcriptional regulator